MEKEERDVWPRNIQKEKWITVQRRVDWSRGSPGKRTYRDQSPFPPAVPDRLKTKERRETTVDMLCYHEKTEKMCFMMVPT